MGLTDKHLAYGDDIPQTQAEKDYYWKIKHQQSCDDCISRQAVIKLLSYDWANRPAHKAVESIRNLQSVTPKEKTGKWIEDANKIDAQFGRHTYICSECGKYAEYFVSGTEVWWDRIKPNFCPNCGIKMEVSK